ncbi:chitin disaccharide deacetylase [Anaerobranca gottschalkii]|uniref:Carbohydrate deacetylase n=1 Tax=Anaerobranca gottschalkii DSM 13577 TaxID=1120990 RepID=A0A1I0AQE9_9FIRM|nr:chitin disaccharide deacetylase [Anaerobranca gottschalkii]SES95680.1 hypothetical protein SAMN03080614_102422 [Anaerobranca gottschalkii DSM 13577]
MLKLIVNADDFGLTKGCNEGIIKSIKEGIVTNTTIMINMPLAEEAINLAKSNGIEQLGIHFNLTCGKPISTDVLSLIDDQGAFYKRFAILKEKMNLEEVEKELRAQLTKFKSTGVKLTHIDSHHHIHMYPGVAEIIADIALEEKVPLRNANEYVNKIVKEKRILTTEYFSMDFYDKKVTLENLKAIISNRKDGILEIMTHPALIDNELLSLSSYTYPREKELEILMSEEIKLWLNEHKIELIRFEDIRDGKIG